MSPDLREGAIASMRTTILSALMFLFFVTGGLAADKKNEEPKTPQSARMEQSYSPDGGKTWEVNWICELSRP